MRPGRAGKVESSFRDPNPDQPANLGASYRLSIDTTENGQRFLFAMTNAVRWRNEFPSLWSSPV